ncbi:MAG: quinohemoprotein amine dehydrogenase subunit alpha [Lautropia sp.]|nr:quinohemoprotein amine dehydrogenase subunit alpha [Lautropia sp.]
MPRLARAATHKRRLAGHGMAALMALGFAPSVLAQDAPQIIKQRCSVCHRAEAPEHWRRISHQRKTPEGWWMTIARMQIMHGLQIEKDEQRAVIKYLSDRQGLAPSETADFRYALERRLNTFENVEPPKYQEMCARCHSGARPLLQRRPQSEWEHLVHFHLSQWPSVEYSQMGRDRDWIGMALTEIAPLLAKQYPHDSDAWKNWQEKRKSLPSPAGQWPFSAHMPGVGAIRGMMSVKESSPDHFEVEMKGVRADGKPLSGQGKAVLYTGHEWRGNIEVDGVRMRQVLSLQDRHLKGRMFETAHDERGMDFEAIQAAADGQVLTPRLLAVQPAYLKAGMEAELHLVGRGLADQKPDFGPGVELLSVSADGEQGLRVKVRTGRDAAVGQRMIRLGSAEALPVSVYQQVDALKVQPAYAVARIGGNGGSAPKVQGRFDAEAWGKDAQGKPFRIGVVPARWSVEPFHEIARRDRDVEFAGQMDEATGVFMPGDAGPNPKRAMSTNNAGNLKVLATIEEGGKQLKGEAQLIVTVPRWNNPPIP